MNSHEAPKNIVPWKKNTAILECLLNNGIAIKQLSDANIEAVIALVVRNKERPGFSGMEDAVFSGQLFHDILSPADDDEIECKGCFVAQNKATKEVIGFVAFNSIDHPEQGNIGGILDLGVDEKYAYGNNEKTRVCNVGSSLLLVACNAIFAQDAHLIYTLASADSNAEDFYKKYYFENDDEDDEEDLVLTVDKYPLLEKTIIARAPEATKKIGLFDAPKHHVKPEDVSNDPDITLRKK